MISSSRKKSETLRGRGMRIRNRASQTVYRENETQTAPWRPPFKGKDNKIPEPVEIDPELNLKTAYFDQHDVNKVKRFRQRKEWDKYLNKIFSPETAELQRSIVEQLEQEKWNFAEKEIDDINQIRLELAQKELEEQSSIIKERMEYRMNNARNKYEELKKSHSQKYQAKLEREIRRTNMKASKLNRYPHKKDGTYERVYNPRPRHLHNPKMQHEVLCPEAIPSTLNDAYMMLERNLVPSKQFKKDVPNRHDCNIPKYYKLPDKTPEKKAKEEIDKLKGFALEEERKRREKKFSDSKSLVATILTGRAIQSMIHRDAIVNYSALIKKYNGGKKLYASGIEEAEKFEISVAEGIRDYNLTMKMREKIQSAVRHLEGNTVASVLDFTSKEFLRLKEHRRLLALADVAERERWTLEAKEAGRRQEEQQRLKQHEEMYKEVMKTHEISSDALLEAILEDEVEATGSGMATMWTKVVADYYKDIFGEPEKQDPYRKLEYASRLADRCLLTQSRNTNIGCQEDIKVKMFGEISEGIIQNIGGALTEISSQDASDMSETKPSDEDKVSDRDDEVYDKTTMIADEDTVMSVHEKNMLCCASDTSTEESLKSPKKSKTQKPSLEKKMTGDFWSESEESEPQISVKTDLDMEKLIGKILDNVVEKAEHYVEQYQENARKLGYSTDFLQDTYADSLSDAYQTLATELLKVSGRKSRESIEYKISPWVDSIINEATKRMASLFYDANDKVLDKSQSRIDDQMNLFKVEDFYQCQEEEIVREEEEESENGGSLEYKGILYEKLQEKLIPEEDKLYTITKKKC